MSEPNGSAASLLAGNPGNPGEPTPPAPAPGGDGGAPPSSGNPPAPPAAGGAFYDSFQDADLKGWLQTKGVKSPEDLALSYKNLEKFVGSEKVPLPKDANDAEGWDRLFKAAGRPDAPDAYGLDKIEGADPEFSKAAAAAFHKAGLNPQQAANLVEFYGAQAKAVQEAQETAFAQQAQLDIGELRRDWGPAFDAKLEAAKRATKLAGLDDATTQKIERSLGIKAAAELFAKIGEATSESTFRSGGSQGGDSAFVTPQGATEKIAQLKADPAWSKRFYDGDAGARAELDRLQKLELGIG